MVNRRSIPRGAEPQAGAAARVLPRAHTPARAMADPLDGLLSIPTPCRALAAVARATADPLDGVISIPTPCRALAVGDPLEDLLLLPWSPVDPVDAPSPPRMRPCWDRR